MRRARTNEFNAERGAPHAGAQRVILVGLAVGGAVAVEVGHGLAHDAPRIRRARAERRLYSRSPSRTSGPRSPRL
jgi:hypothetical protein